MSRNTASLIARLSIVGVVTFCALAGLGLYGAFLPAGTLYFLFADDED